MGGLSRERGSAPVSGKPWNAAGGRSGDGPVARQAVTGCGAEALPTCGGSHHEEEQAQEGQVGHSDIKRDWMMRTDFHEDEGPEDDQRHRVGKS